MTSKRPRIHLIEMGGTITCLAKQKAAEFYNKPTESITPLIEQLKMDVELTTEVFCKKISHEIETDELLLLAKKIQKIIEIDSTTGVVVTTGTNALEEIAYFIGLVVKTKKPIVFTGSYFPQNSFFFEGGENLYNAICVASSKEAKNLGVLVTFNDYVVTARDAIKVSPGFLNNFTFNGYGVVGAVLGGKFIIKSERIYRHTYRTKFNLATIETLPPISIIYGSIGMTDFLINASINAKVAGIISAGFGTGYQSTKITRALIEAIRSGIPVVRCSRSGVGQAIIDPSYDKKYGFIVASDIQPHKASILLSVALGTGCTHKKLQEIFKEY